MPDMSEYIVACVACDGDGCDACEQRGTLISPSALEKQITRLRSTIYLRRTARRKMLDTYLRWLHTTENRRELVAEIGRADPYEFDLEMTGDIVDCSEQLDQMLETLEVADSLLRRARTDLREAKRATQPSTPPAPPEPPPAAPKHTKAAGRVCRSPRCPKDAQVWDEKGAGWCRRHAYARGLLGEPEKKQDVKRRRRNGSG